MKTAYRNDIFRREDTSFLGDLVRSVGDKPGVHVRTMSVRPLQGPHTPAPALHGLSGGTVVLRGRAELGDLLNDAAAQIAPLQKDLDSLLATLPVGAVSDGFRTRRDACLALEPIAKYKCLYDLYVDIKKALNNPAPNPYPVPASTADQPPWLWIGVAAAGALALAAVVVAISRK